MKTVYKLILVIMVLVLFVSCTGKEKDNSNLEIKFSYVDVAKKREPSDFSQLFKKRFIAIEKILRNRRELQNVTSINRILTKKAKEDVAKRLGEKSHQSGFDVVIRLMAAAKTEKRAEEIILEAEKKKEKFPQYYKNFEQVLSSVGLSIERLRNKQYDNKTFKLIEFIDNYGIC